MTQEHPEDPSLLVTSMLRRLEWSPVSKAAGRYEVWAPHDNASDEVVVPLNPENGDFGLLLDRAHRYLIRRYGAEAERIEALLNITAAAGLDSTQWKKETSVDAGLIPWAEGESIYTAARESLTAAARAVRSKRAVQGNSGGFLARHFMEQVFMGQTQVGSFIVTAHLPASARFHVSRSSEKQSLLDPRKAETVSGRAIVDVFEASIIAVREALNEYKRAPRIESFNELIPEGVSFELIRSLATLARNGDAAVAIQRGGLDVVTNEIEFDSTEAVVLDRVAATFAKAPEMQKVTLVGEVSLLDNSTAAPIHLVRVDVMKGANVRRVRVRLTPTQYILAVEAHARHEWLKVSGSLEKDGRDWWLYNATDVSAVSPDEGPVATTQTMWEESTFINE